jgi:acetylornithine deacetylase/succinyl-diaminopimelate desuccinylase-like protein
MASSSIDSPIWQDEVTVRRAREVGAQFADKVIETARVIAMVAAPTNDERDRAVLVADLFQTHGATNVSIDQIQDVVGRIAGRTGERALLLAAHTDTVFSRETVLKIDQDEERGYGPGLGDNSLGVAAVVMLPEMLRAMEVEPATDILLTGNVGEEGLGNLRGITQVLTDNEDVGAVIAIEGQNLGRITHIAVGSVRLRVTVVGPGGHSWGDFGNPSAIHAAARLIDQLDRIPLTQTPKTTLNVGMIHGGISINSIAPSVTFDVDLRSTDPVALKRVVDRLHAALTPRDERISVEVEVLGKRPAGQVAVTSRIVVAAAEILRSLSFSPAADASSTDANAAIAMGLPAVCIGLTTGGNAHRLDEYIDLAPVKTGLAQLLLLTLAVSEDLAQGRLSP